MFDQGQEAQLLAIKVIAVVLLVAVVVVVAVVLVVLLLIVAVILVVVIVVLLVLAVAVILLAILLIHRFALLSCCDADSFARSRQTMHGKKEAESDAHSKRPCVYDGV